MLKSLQPDSLGRFRDRVANSIKRRSKSIPILYATLKGAANLFGYRPVPQAVTPPQIETPAAEVKPRIVFEDLDALLAEITRRLNQPNVEQQLAALSEVFFKIDASELNAMDPFSQQYREGILALYKRVSKNHDYDPMGMEKTDAADNCDLALNPIPYRLGSSRIVGEFLSCYGWILSSLDVQPGADVLEYGSGEGQLSIHLARMGCNVHAIDIEERFLAAIRRQCERLGVSVTTRVGCFGDGIDGKRFDRILFFEAFHHCFDHFNALLRIRELLKPNGFICFSGEPIISAEAPDPMILPYPWGLRLDGESMRSIAEFGWMELGYCEPYFMALLGRCGYTVERKRCPGFSRGDVYIARKFDDRYPIDRDTLISSHNGKSGWHSSEGTHRWTKGDAWFPLPATGYDTVGVRMENAGPKPTDVLISGPCESKQLTLESGKETRVVLTLPASGGDLRIQSGTFVPKDVDPSSTDWRTLGVLVKAIEFHKNLA